MLCLADSYQPLIGPRAMRRLLSKARRLSGLRVLHVSSTRRGGGVAEILSRLTPLMNAAGIAADWQVIAGTDDSFAFTKEVHNALQGAPIDVTPRKANLHREVVLDQASGVGRDYDVVIVHDPQPLSLIASRGREVWIWCCHVDLTEPDPGVWSYLAPLVNRYDAAVFSLAEYAQDLVVPQRFIMPAIDPTSPINRPLAVAEVCERLRSYSIPLDRPLVVQVGRFDRWKDPQGVIDAFCMAGERLGATLVLAGNTAPDDPEGPQIFETVCRSRSERVLVLQLDDPLLVNALQRRAAVVLQKSIREGFGLTVSEAMWKGRAVIGGDTGGIRQQIIDAENGYLVEDIPRAAARIVN
jgi:trehalose synthase